MQITPSSAERASESPAGHLHVAAQHGDRGCTIRLRGELDTASAPELCAQVAPWLQSCRSLILDLREVSFMDSAGLRAVLDLYRCLNDRNVSLRLIEGDRGNVAHVLRRAGLESLIDRDECRCD
jgi:anti-anti-sigma factor